MRMTHLRRQILSALRPPTSARDVIYVGMPPYGAADVAEKLEHPCLSNVARALRQMEDAGLVVSETTKKEVWAHLAKQGTVSKDVKGYWVAEHLEEDKAAVEQLKEDRKAIQQEALDNMFKRFS